MTHHKLASQYAKNFYKGKAINGQFTKGKEAYKIYFKRISKIVFQEMVTEVQIYCDFVIKCFK